MKLMKLGSLTFRAQDLLRMSTHRLTTGAQAHEVWQIYAKNYWWFWKLQIPIWWGRRRITIPSTLKITFVIRVYLAPDAYPMTLEDLSLEECTVIVHHLTDEWKSFDNIMEE